MSARDVFYCAAESFLNFSQLICKWNSNKENEEKVNEWEEKENKNPTVFSSVTESNQGADSWNSSGDREFISKQLNGKEIAREWLHLSNFMLQTKQ